ncbi:MAG: BrnT family toxin [Pseudomonadota bacterium]
MYEWDEAKRQSNLAKHGVDFADMEWFDWDTAVFMRTDVVDYEFRESAVGLIGDILHVVIYTDRELELTRIISMRRASTYETKIWNHAQTQS